MVVHKMRCCSQCLPDTCFNTTALLKPRLTQIFPHRDVDMWGRVWTSRFRGAWQSLNFDKEYLFGFETLVFATSGILSMHNQLVTLQRESKTWNHIIWPLQSSVCIWYDSSFTQMKWLKMLVKWLSDQFWRYCSCIYVLIEAADAEITARAHTRCVCNVSKQNRASAPFTQRLQNMQDSYLNRLLQLNIYKILVHIAIWFKCNDLLMIIHSKLWQNSKTFRVKL